jgi:hypothetical protein
MFLTSWYRLYQADTNLEIPKNRLNRWLFIALTKYETLPFKRLLNTIYLSHETDVLVVGGNPILNMLAVLDAIRKQQKVVLCPIYVDDRWPYELLRHPAVRHFLKQLLGGSIPEPDQVLGMEFGQVSDEEHLDRYLEKWMEGFFQALEQAMLSVPDHHLLRVQPVSHYRLGQRSTKDECVLYALAPKARTQERPFLKRVLASWRKVFAGKIAPLHIVHKKPYINCFFARQVIVTSDMPDGFGTSEIYEDQRENLFFDFPGKAVRLLGNARVHPKHKEEAVWHFIQDLYMAMGKVYPMPDNLEKRPANYAAGADSGKEQADA